MNNPNNKIVEEFEEQFMNWKVKDIQFARQELRHFFIEFLKEKLPELRQQTLSEFIEKMEESINKIIKWWEEELSDEERSELLGGESWKGEVSERHARLRLIYLVSFLKSLQEKVGEEGEGV